MLFEIKTQDIYVLEMAEDFPCHLHTHMEIYICIEGELCGYCNNQERTLKKGDVMISFPNDIHSYKKTNCGKGLIIIFTPYISDLVAADLNKYQYNNFVHEEKVIPIAYELYHYAKDLENHHIAYGYLHVIIGMVLKKKLTEMPTVFVNVFDSAIRYISHNYTEPITLAKTAKEIGVSQEHLSRAFSKRIDGGFKIYLRILRVEKAKRLLEVTNLNINEILLESGFSDQRTFNRIFKSTTNMTPREYRAVSQKK